MGSTIQVSSYFKVHIAEMRLSTPIADISSTSSQKIYQIFFQCLKFHTPILIIWTWTVDYGQGRTDQDTLHSMVASVYWIFSCAWNYRKDGLFFFLGSQVEKWAQVRKGFLFDVCFTSGERLCVIIAVLYIIGYLI